MGVQTKTLRLHAYFGRCLIDVCLKAKINGRVDEDKGVGNFTYHGSNGSSVVDYIITSQSLYYQTLRILLYSHQTSFLTIHH